MQRTYSRETRVRFVALVSASSEVVELPETVPRIYRDAEDDWVIACAVVGKADVVVSGDRDLLNLKRAGDIPVLSASLPGSF